MMAKGHSPHVTTGVTLSVPWIGLVIGGWLSTDSIHNLFTFLARLDTGADMASTATTGLRLFERTAADAGAASATVRAVASATLLLSPPAPPRFEPRPRLADMRTYETAAAELVS